MTVLTKTLDNTRKIIDCSDNIRNYVSRHNKICKDSSVDKHKLIFTTQKTNSCALSLNIILEQYRGTYGSSSVSTDRIGSNIEQDMLNKALSNFLNNNMELFFNGLADELEKLAREQKENCLREITEAQDIYNKYFPEDLV